jgi:hypothetical protein
MAENGAAANRYRRCNIRPPRRMLTRDPGPELRVQGDPAQLVKLEPQILEALHRTV